MRLLGAAVLLTTGLTLGVASPAMSVPLSCTTVYAIQGDAPHNLYSVDTGTGAMTSVDTIDATSTPTNALGISADGQDVFTSNGSLIWHYDTDTGNTTEFAGAAGAGSTHGAVNPATGIYYYGSIVSGSANVYGFDPATNTSLGLVAVIGLDSPPGGNGDWAFDSQGNLYLTAGEAPNNALYVVSQQLPTTSGPAASPSSERIANITSIGNSVNGVAFGPGGFLYLASQGAILRVNPSSGAVLDTTTLSPSGESVDLGSCTTPSTITVRKDIDGRFAPTDQFQVSVTGGGLTTGNTGTTTGTDEGLQTDPDETAGPVLGLEGTTYDITETGQSGADLANYATEWACVNTAAGDAPVSSGTGAAGSFTMPSPDGGTGAVVVCTFTNTAQIPSLLLEKTADTPVDVNNNGITDAGDTIQYSFTLTNDGNVQLSALAVNDPLAGAVTCADTALAPTESTGCTADAVYVVTAADEDAGSVDNTASATGEDPGGAEVPSNEDSTTTPVTAADPVLTLDKIAGAPDDVNNNGITDAGDTIAFTFTLTNDGNVSLSALAVSDPLVGAVTCDDTSLAPGASTDCAADELYVVTADDEDAGAVDNTASATGEDPGGVEVPSNEDSTTTPVTAADPVLTLDKIAGAPVDVNGSGITDAGDTIAFTFVLTNDGNVPLTDIAVSDPTVGAVTCDATTLAPGASTDCAADELYVVTEADEDTGSVDNTAVASSQDSEGNEVPSNEDSTSTPVTTPNPVLTLEKFAGAPVDVNGSGITDAGDTIAFTFTLTNDGNVPLNALSVSDPTVGAVNCVDTTLAPGASTDCAADELYVVTEADEDAGSVDNTATGLGEDPDGGEVPSNEDSTSTPVTKPNPVLTLEKVAGTPADVNSSGITDAGDTIAFTFVLTNDGNVPLTGMVVDDPLVGAVTCAATALAPGASTDCAADALYVVTEADEDAGSVDNTATGLGEDPDGEEVPSDEDSTSTPVTKPNPVLTLDKQAGTPVDVNGNEITDAGDTIAFTFVLTNDGNVPLTGIVVDDPKVGTVTCVDTSLAVGDSTTCSAGYVITQVDVDSGSVDNTATAEGTDPDDDPVSSNTDATSTPVEALPGLSIDKSAALTDGDGDDKADVGEEIVYTFTVTNTGNVTLSDVAVADPLAGAVTCVDVVLAPGASTDCAADAPYVVTQAVVDGGDVVNTATATGTAPGGTPVGSDPDTTTTPSDAVPAMDLVKSSSLRDRDGDDRADPGERIRYRFAVTNTGTVTLVDVTIQDDMLADAGVAVDCPQDTLVPGEEMTCTAAYTVTAADVQDGGSLVNTATAGGCVPGGECTASRAVASPDSSASTPVDRPEGSSPGGAGSDSGALPDTGGPSSWLWWLGGGLVAAGLVLVMFRRRIRPLA